MRCPKCQYISFDNGERCRNCGYEFSLAVEESPVDVPIARDQPPPGRVRETALDVPLTPSDPRLESDRDDSFPAPLPGADDLPLFTERVADDQAPLVTPPAVPRPPLAVRRAGPAARRARTPDHEELSLDLSPEAFAEKERSETTADHEEAAPAARLFRRVLAGLIDASILSGIAATVFYLTLRLCELTLDQWRVLPLPPLIAFLLLVCGGYLVLFTAAGGQTIGKMAARLRVVTNDGERRLPIGTVVIRALVCLVSVLTLGAGFLPAVFDADRRTLHDRIAGTRVVPA